MTLHVAVLALISRGLYTLKRETVFYFASKWQLLFTHGCIIYNNYTEGQSRIFWDYSFHVKFDLRVCVCVCVCMYARSCLSLCNPIDCSPPGSSVRGIFQARMLGRVVISSSRYSSQPDDQTHVSSSSWIWQADSLPLSQQGRRFFGHLMRRVDLLEKTLMLGGIGARRKKGTTEDEIAGWHHWLDGPGSWWWTGRPGVLPFMGSQRVGHDWATELNRTELILIWVHQYSKGDRELLICL